jgi:hypothetical protein
MMVGQQHATRRIDIQPICLHLRPHYPPRHHCCCPHGPQPPRRLPRNRNNVQRFGRAIRVRRSPNALEKQGAQWPICEHEYLAYLTKSSPRIIGCCRSGTKEAHLIVIQVAATNRSGWRIFEYTRQYAMSSIIMRTFSGTNMEEQI